MDKLKAIIKREYLTRVRSKGFIFGTIASPLLLVGYMFLPALIVKLNEHAHHQIAILDQSGDAALYQVLEKSFTARQPVVSRRGRSNTYELRREAVASGEDLAARQQKLDQQIATGQLSGYVILPPDVLNQESLVYHAKNVGDFETRSRVEYLLSEAISTRRLALAGIDSTRVNELSKRVELRTINQRGEEEQGQTFAITFGLIIVIYISILVYGIMVMRGVIEEKQWRIIEVLLSSVKPFELMLGKLIGIGLVGLTQFAVWSLTGILLSLLSVAPALAAFQGKLPKISITLMIFFVVYFVLGYFLYATLYAMVGAIVSNEEDGQQMQIPVTMTIVVPIMISALVMQNPNSPTSVVLSLVPFFSPLLMFMRIGFQPPPVWQIALSIVLLIGTILGLIWLAAKVYRVGVLMYGKRPTLPEVVRWLKYS